MSDLLPNLATRVDDLAFIHGIKVDNNNHGPAVYHTLTGSQFPGSASIGAWVTYGLGSENRDLPGFIVLGDRRGSTIGGAGVWGNGFLPAAYQGTLFRNGETPIVDLKRAAGKTEQAAAPGTGSAELVEPRASGCAAEHGRVGCAHRCLRARLPDAEPGARPGGHYAGIGGDEEALRAR